MPGTYSMSSMPSSSSSHGIAYSSGTSSYSTTI